MSLVYMDGFNDLSSAYWRMDSQTRYRYFTNPESLEISSTLVLGVRLNFNPNRDRKSGGFILSDGTNRFIQLGFSTGSSNNDRYLYWSIFNHEVYTEHPTTDNVWRYFETKVTVGDSLSQYELYVNGDLVKSGEVTTEEVFLTSEGYDRIIGYASQNDIIMNVDDVYILNGGGSVNNDIIGPCKIIPAVPNNIGSHTNFNPSIATDNYSLVSGIPPSGDYVSADQSGAVDTYGFSDLQASDGDIKAVKVLVDCEKTEAGARKIAAVARHNLEESISTECSISVGRFIKSGLFEVNPSTGLPWTTEEFNNTEFGIKITS